MVEDNGDRRNVLDFIGPFKRLVQFVYEFILHSVASLFMVGTINLAERLSELFGDMLTVTWQVDTAHQFSAKDILHWSDLGIFACFIAAGIWNGIRIMGGHSE